MKKIFLVLAAATLLFSACTGDTCRCTTKTYDGDGNLKTTVSNVDSEKPEDSTCKEVAEAASYDLGDLGKIVVTCKTVQSE